MNVLMLLLASALMAKLDASQPKYSNFSNERFRFNSALDEINKQLDIYEGGNIWVDHQFPNNMIGLSYQ